MNETAIISPNNLWRDFDVSIQNPDISFVFSKTEHGLTKSGFYFTAGEFSDGKIRAYAELEYLEETHDKYDDKMPVVIIAADMRSEQAGELNTRLVNSGFAVIRFDFLGRRDTGRFTLYPESLNFANLDVSSGNLYSVVSEAKKTCWYIWSVLARRLITLTEKLPDTDPSRVSIAGFGHGGNIVYQVAAMDGRISAAAVIGESGWAGYGLLHDTDAEQTNMFDDEHARFIYSLSSQSYAKLVKKPFLMHLNTNAEDSSFDRGFDTFSRLPQQLKTALSISPGFQNSIGYTQRANLVSWLKYHMLHEGKYCDTPEISTYLSEDKLYARLKTDNTYKIKSVEFYYAYDTVDSAIRNWHRLPALELGENEFIAKLEVLKPDQFIFVFGTVNYENNISVSSKLIAKSLKETKVALSLPATSRLIYDSKNAFDCWAVTGLKTLFNDKKILSIKKGPLKIDGITSHTNRLSTFKLSDPKFYGYDNDLLQLSVFSEFPQTVRISITERIDARWRGTYSAVLKLSGGEQWTKINIPPQDFKSPDGIAAESWEDMAFLVVESESELLVSSVLWA